MHIILACCPRIARVILYCLNILFIFPLLRDLHVRVLLPAHKIKALILGGLSLNSIVLVFFLIIIIFPISVYHSTKISASIRP